MSGALGRQVAVGAAFMVAARLAGRLVGVASTLILARLLLPEDFGIIALATAAFAVAETALATGYAVLVLRRESVDRDVYDTAWTMNLIRCLLLAAITVAAAPLQAWAFAEPRIEGVLYVVAATCVLEGLASIGTIRMQRELRFDVEFRLQFVQRLLSFALTVALALLLGNYWCLVIGNLVARIVTIPYSYLIAPHRPRFCLRHWREFLNFSKWIFAFNACGALDGQAPNLILGGLLGVTHAGRYAVAYQISASPITEIAAPIRRPLYAGYARVQEDAERLRRNYLDSLGLLAAVILPLSAGIALVAPEVERIALGPNWAGTAPLISLSAFYALAESIAFFTHNVLMLRDRLRLMVLLFGGVVVLRMPLVALGAWLGGPEGMLLVLTATSVANALAWQAAAGRELGYGLGMVWSELRRPAIGVAVMSAAVLALRAALPGAAPGIGGALGHLALLSGLGAAVHVGTVAALWRMDGRHAGPETRIFALLQAACGRALPRLRR